GASGSGAKRTAGWERCCSSRFNDANTTANVKSELLWNRNTGGLDNNITTRDGVVTLEGRADSDAASELAERLARNTEGVRRVENKLSVSAEGGTADRAREQVDNAGGAKIGRASCRERG